MPGKAAKVDIPSILPENKIARYRSMYLAISFFAVLTI